MPKERRDRSVSFDRCMTSPYPCSSSHPRQSSPKTPSETEENLNEWEEARCPVCMEHPHNAVLLICSSHEKGCRPYMCDTSYRHSNCLDQYRKSSSETSTSPPPPQQERTQILTTMTSPDLASELGSEVTTTSDPISEVTVSCENHIQPKLLCPLCRGDIKEWIVVEPAREFMNAKSRSCACETCAFSGTYTDLRKHARSEHPLVRPSETDPERQRNWRRLERQRDIGDLLSTLQSFGGEESVLPGLDGGGSLTVFIVRVIPRGTAQRSTSWTGVRRRSSRLWGESFYGEAGSPPREEEDDSDGGSGPWRRPRVRRRTSPDNQP